jgi:cell wall-associated NlpC family hydrolase
MARRLLALLLLAVAVPALALPPEKAKVAVAAARELLGRTYQFGGRLRGGEGIDCQGLVFYALERISTCGWKSYSVNPTETVSRKELGDRVPGLFPVATADLDPGLLQAGDLVMLLADAENPREPSMITVDETQLWVWHVGMATGDGKWIQADPFAGEVIEGELITYLRDHPEYYGIAVTRMARGPKPGRCRQHPPMEKQPISRK